ncbi:MAG: CHAT domain-containing protein [Bacteroidales bacterium]|nr:CHAT domain-containing protein [Bacteroidales bacterium]
MAISRFYYTCLIGLFLFLGLPGNAQPLDTLALRARADSLNQAGAAYLQIGELALAEKDFQEAVRIQDTVLRDRTVACASCLNSYGASQLYLGNYGKAIEVFTKAAGIAEEVLGKQHQFYANCINNIGLCHMVLSDYPKAIDYISQARDIIADTFGTKHPSYALCLNNLGNCYQEMADFEKAIAYYTDAAAIHREILGENNLNYAGCINNIGNCYQEMSEYGKAIEYLTRAMEIRHELVDERHPDFVACYTNLGNCYYFLGDVNKALEFFEKSLALNRAIYGDRQPAIAINLEEIGNCHFDLGDYEKSIAYMTEALDIYRESMGERHPHYANTLNNLGNCLTGLGDYEKAYSNYREALDIYRETEGERHPDYAHTLKLLGTYYNNVGKPGEAVKYFSESLDIYRSIFGQRNRDVAASINFVGEAYSAMGERDSTSAYIRSYFSLVSDLVLDAFTYLPQNQRSAHWNTFNGFFMERLPQYTRFLSNDKEFLCTAYDGALFSKGLLLNAETELRRLILESGDEDALLLYNRLQDERSLLDQLYAQPVSERTMPTDSLENLYESLERELQQKSRAFGDFTNNLSISWQDVQSALGKRDIAIEFLKVPVSEDTTLYCALTLKKGYDAPHYVELFDMKDLEALQAKYAGRQKTDGLIYGDAALYDLVWKPLEKELKGVNNIYFGPSGELYQTAIEYADNGKGPLATRKNIFRLSSTRQLAVARGETEHQRSAVFGGLKYGASFNVDSLDIRGAGGGLMVADLPGTEAEALEIDALLRKEGLDNTLRMGEEGTEAAFKDLSGRRENIIHIATHGFYWNGKQARGIADGQARNLANGSDRLQEDVSMTRSGLLFSGANNALHDGFAKKEGVEDGILTAKEIAQMDLRGTDLLVLSACQTGLGEVSGEGVFGLQRGFKKAGVNTILMSLWEVDDEATQLLMTRFYKGLTEGLSKTDALKKAQDAVRANKGRDFSSPYYWAAFILLDGN